MTANPQFKRDNSCRDKTDAVIKLLEHGLENNEKLNRLERLLELGLLKNLYMTRRIIGEQDESFLKEIDDDFDKNRADIEKMIFEFGADWKM